MSTWITLTGILLRYEELTRFYVRNCFKESHGVRKYYSNVVFLSLQVWYQPRNFQESKLENNEKKINLDTLSLLNSPSVVVVELHICKWTSVNLIAFVDNYFLFLCFLPSDQYKTNFYNCDQIIRIREVWFYAPVNEPKAIRSQMRYVCKYIK